MAVGPPACRISAFCLDPLQNRRVRDGAAIDACRCQIHSLINGNERSVPLVEIRAMEAFVAVDGIEHFILSRIQAIRYRTTCWACNSWPVGRHGEGV